MHPHLFTPPPHDLSAGTNDNEYTTHTHPINQSKSSKSQEPPASHTAQAEEKPHLHPSTTTQTREANPASRSDAGWAGAKNGSR